MNIDVTAAVFQVTALGTIGALLPWAFRIRAPRPLLAYWQALLAVMLLLPFMPLLMPVPAAASGAFPIWRFTATVTANSRHWLTGRSIGFVLYAVSALRICWLLMGMAMLRRYRKSGVLLDCACPVEVRICREIKGPVSFGLWRPVILVPSAWPAMAPKLQTAVLCHEQAHIRRHDWILHLAEELVCATLWFQPAVWYVVERIRGVREQVVDQEVVRQTGHRESYVEALVSTAVRSRAGVFPLPAPCFARRHQLVERIRNLMRDSHMSRRRIVATFALAAVVLIPGGRAAMLAFPRQGADLRRVYRVGNGVMPPRVQFKVDPDYAEAARAARLQGTVLLRLVVSDRGTAENIQVYKSLGDGLDEKAVEAIRKWRFVPGTKDGQAVAVMASIEVNFRLK